MCGSVGIRGWRSAGVGPTVRGDMMETPLSVFVDTIEGALTRMERECFEQRTEPEFLELLEEGEDWVKKMRNFLRADT